MKFVVFGNIRHILEPLPEANAPKSQSSNSMAQSCENLIVGETEVQWKQGKVVM